ncbi:esterase/lipase family protein [Hymenobacter nivis]|uniref:Alpha/beta fold hydrolase n=1 Tax=Hymenobacter nivis TaxID=1850093 RepID=A0A502H2I1_9BACT|nr:alpha/beta hydrolase [Hymenobacter nivis]TPG67576.1 alpha/beta fold hydrolase [Hymenobacter nivis]
MSEPLPEGQPSRLRRALAAAGRVATAPARGAAYLVDSARAHQHFFLPVLNGALGDQLAARHDPRALRMSFRVGGHDVPVAALALRGPRRPTVVFVHGLMGDEQIWQTGLADAPDYHRYGPRLAAETDARVLYVRFNSGLHLSENGRALSLLLTELATTYPDALGPLALVGHSMGGLVIRSAGYYGSTGPLAAGSEPLAVSNESLAAAKPTNELGQPSTESAPWLAYLRAVFLLGTPNDGSWLEQNSHFAAHLLQRIDLFPTRFLSNALNQRSNGIKDLRRSILVDEDWQGPQADDRAAPRTAVPLLPGVAYHILMGAWLKTNRPAALRQYFGDGLVSRGSAQGATTFGNEAALPPGTTVRTAEFHQQHHSGLLTHPEVYQYLKHWL